jgi:hypothetical protein
MRRSPVVRRLAALTLLLTAAVRWCLFARAGRSASGAVPLAALAHR